MNAEQSGRFIAEADVFCNDSRVSIAMQYHSTLLQLLDL